MRRVAPTLEMLVASIDKTYWHKPDADAARAELRALISVARAAKRLTADGPNHADANLVGVYRALNRLDKASGREAK